MKHRCVHSFINFEKLEPWFYLIFKMYIGNNFNYIAYH